MEKKKLDDLRSEKVDLNENSEKFEECCLYDLIDVALNSGRVMFFGISYSVVPSQIKSAEFAVDRNPHIQFVFRLLHIFFFLFLIIPLVTEWDWAIIVSSCSLVKYVGSCLRVVMIFCVFGGYYCLEIKGKRFRGGMACIFRQCVILQNKFKAVGLHFPTRAKVRAFGWIMSISICSICVIRQIIFTTKMNPWYTRHARFFSRTISLGFWALPNETEPDDSTLIFLGSLGIVVEGFTTNFWYFVQYIHFSFAVTMWAVFDKLNKGMKNGYFEAKHLPKVVDLHFESTKLLKLINQVISPITFWLIVFDIICLCFWTQYLEFDANVKIRPIYIAAVGFLLKTGVEILLVADVNAKMHEISEWLEECCTNSEDFPAVDPMKFTVFTSQIYSRESTGFRGLNFFIVTPRLAITVAGIVITYSVALDQLCKSD